MIWDPLWVCNRKSERNYSYSTTDFFFTQETLGIAWERARAPRRGETQATSWESSARTQQSTGGQQCVLLPSEQWPTLAGAALPGSITGGSLMGQLRAAADLDGTLDILWTNKIGPWRCQEYWRKGIFRRLEPLCLQVNPKKPAKHFCITVIPNNKTISRLEITDIPEVAAPGHSPCMFQCWKVPFTSQVIEQTFNYEFSNTPTCQQSLSRAIFSITVPE